MPTNIPPPTQLSYQTPEAQQRRQRTRTLLAGALAGARAAQQLADAGQAPPGAPPMPFPGAPLPPVMPAMPVAAPGAPAGGAPLPMAPSMGAAPMPAPAPAPLQGGPVAPPPGGAPPFPMAMGGMVPAFAGGGQPADMNSSYYRNFGPLSKGGPLAPAGPNMAGMTPEAPDGEGLDNAGPRIFEALKAAMDGQGGPMGGAGIGQELAGNKPEMSQELADNGEAESAPPAFVAWLSGPAMQSDDPLAQDLARIYTQDPESAGELWDVVQGLVQSGDESIPPDLAALVAGGDAQSMDTAPTPALPDEPPPVPHAKGGRVRGRSKRKGKGR